MCWVCDPFNNFEENICLRGSIFQKISFYHTGKLYSRDFSMHHSISYIMITKNINKSVHDRIKLYKLLSNMLPPCISSIIVKYIPITQ
jgi:hypothetical protein